MVGSFRGIFLGAATNPKPQSERRRIEQRRGSWRKTEHTYDIALSCRRARRQTCHPPIASCHSSAPFSTMMKAADNQASTSGTPRTRQPPIRFASDV